MTVSGEYRYKSKDEVLGNVSNIRQHKAYRLTIIMLITAAWFLG